MLILHYAQAHHILCYICIQVPAIMSSYAVSVSLLLFCIWSCNAETSTGDSKPNNDQDVVISILNRRNETGQSSTQVGQNNIKASSLLT